ncbi:hypothetical protein D7D52_33575 [Nocardia yunnanensis]|uniref:Recombinase family protein n=1 Tax=Nocardia yunnanensis TaxID=2382165 RepID=A0A386ZJ95_9NOCA|nr:hypothetical protein [Nocardia yunnanensis]AYF77932.1 hypothetical protein D7D52_33575 [Nocardia yunnanensis]
MRYRPAALGYLRTDVSGVSQLWDEHQIRSLATRLGYDFCGTIVFDPRTEQHPLARVRNQARRLRAEAVITPSPNHFANGTVPGDLVKQLDVITVNPEATYARWSTGLVETDQS